MARSAPRWLLRAGRRALAHHRGRASALGCWLSRQYDRGRTGGYPAPGVRLERYEGQFTRAVESAQQSAVSLALLLAREFSSFHDVAEWHGQPVPFLKRAQICVADLNAAFQGQHWGAFTDLDQLTAFADYKLPQLLRRYGVLVYSGELAAQVDQMQPIAPGSEQEIEIRAATIWGVEWLRRALAERGIVRPASAIDYRLWADSQTATPDMRPYHRTRTIYY